MKFQVKISETSLNVIEILQFWNRILLMKTFLQYFPYGIKKDTTLKMEQNDWHYFLPIFISKGLSKFKFMTLNIPFKLCD